MRQFRHAESKIYLREQPAWDGKWELLLLESAEKRARAAEKELGWLGFGQIASNLMAAPTHAQTDVTALLGELNAGEQVIYFRADYLQPLRANPAEIGGRLLVAKRSGGRLSRIYRLLPAADGAAARSRPGGADAAALFPD